MAGTFPRRQAARLAGLLGTHFVPGLTCLEAPPRRGKSDFLRQLFGALLTQRAVAPVLLSLGSRRLPDGASEQAAAQLLAFAEGRLRSPAVPLNRDRLVEREDAAAWHEFLNSYGLSPTPEHFFAALAALADRIGPVCLLLDDAPEDCLRAAAAIGSPALAVMAAPGSRCAPGAAQVLALEEFSVREGVLLAEGLARSLGVDLSGEAAEAFVAYAGSDPFALQSVVRGAAASGAPLKTGADFARAYLNELSRGTLAAYFRSRLPGQPGSPERRFALEAVSGGTLDAARLARWRHRLAVDEVLEEMQREGWVEARGANWALRPWPAVRDWAALESADDAGRAAGTLMLRLLAALEATARAHAAERVASRIAAGLATLTPAAAAWLAGNGVRNAQVPEVCHVTSEEIPGGELFLCYGFTDGRRQAEAAALLAVAVLADDGHLPPTLEEMNRRAVVALPPAAAGSPAMLEKWVVLKNPGPADLELAQRAGARLLEFGLFNRLIAPTPKSASAGTAASEVVLKLPMSADFEISAVRVLDHLLERHNCDKRAAAQARIALVEACLNAIEHGRAAQLDPAAAQMEVRLSATTEAVEMAVTNPGPPFQPENGEETGGAGLHRGHGLKIIRSLMDRVSITSDLKGTTIRMTKRLPAAQAGAAPGSSENEETAPGIERN